MVSAEDLVEANRRIRALGAAELESLWATLNLGDVEATNVALVRIMPSLVFKYGDMAAAIAADIYAEWREEARAASRYESLMAELMPEADVQRSTRYAVGGLYRDPPDPEAVLSLLKNDVLDRFTQNQGRLTIARNVAADPERPRWARIPVGVTCEWCLMLGSRGFAPGYGYRTEVTASAASHGSCDCVLAPSWATGELIDNYDANAVYDQWQAAKRQRAADKK